MRDTPDWQPFTPLLPVLYRLQNGERAAAKGQMWRRKFNGRWQYRQDEETDDEWERRQW